MPIDEQHEHQHQNDNDRTTATTIVTTSAAAETASMDDMKTVSVAHDLIAGGIAGSASVIVGHPFDTIKVRLQTSSSTSTTMMSTFKSTSPMSLFRGMAAPLSTAAMVNAIIFAAYGTSSRWWDQYYPYNGNYNALIGLGGSTIGIGTHSHKTNSIQLQPEHDPWHKSFVCGSFAGFCQALIICPMEHLKCRLQLPNSSYKGPVQAAKSIFKSHGVSGLYRGINSTLIREIPAFGAYFSVYDAVKDAVNTYFDTHNSSSSQHSWLASAFAGGVSGSVTWVMIYPVDVIKTRIQTSPMNSVARSELQVWHVGKKIVEQHGWRHLFRGLNVTLIRAFPVNGIIFPVYEFTLSHLTDL